MQVRRAVRLWLAFCLHLIEVYVLAVFRYFRAALLFTVLGLIMAAAIGYAEQESWRGVWLFLFIVAVLSALEISLSFDNAIINAKILRTMTPIWRHRFLTWGMLLAVFGMRIIFPLIIVAFAAHINPFAALKLAVAEPQTYAHIMEEAHLEISAFGGTFLLMVGLSFFFDRNKKVHWIRLLEVHAKKLAHAHGVETAITLLVIIGFCSAVDDKDQVDFLLSALYGLLTYLGIEILSAFLDSGKQEMGELKKAGLGAFLYLEMLDAAFSFDGVIGAFALTSNIFIIAIGLGIGAFYVRSLTLLLVEQENLTEYRYLEHGAFYAILSLALLMYMQAFFPVPEIITGFVGVLFIIAGYVSSRRWQKKQLLAVLPPANSSLKAKSGSKGG